MALHWGNEDFDRPGIDFLAFVQGVTFHDWGYGLLDNLPILEADEDDWLVFMKRGVAYDFDDPSTDIIVKLHIRRLLLGEPSPGRRQLVGRIDELVRLRLRELPYSLADFYWIDFITRFCDSISFRFCFGEPAQGSLPIARRWQSPETTEICYEISEAGAIRLHPWPFSVPAFSGLITAYKRDGYPDQLHPAPLPFHFLPR